MSIDHYYTQIDGNWVNTETRVVNGKWEYIPSDERPDFRTDFWVDICHGGNCLIDERYYFADLASALDFYLRGGKQRQYLDRDGKEMGLDHSGLYSRGRLIHGRSIHGDAPGHEGENLRQIFEELVRRMGEEGSGMRWHPGHDQGASAGGSRVWPISDLRPAPATEAERRAHRGTGGLGPEEDRIRSICKEGGE